MRLTANQLRQIIREEVARVTEAPAAGRAASPGSLVRALNVAQLVSEIDNEYAPRFEVDNTDKRSFRPGDVVLDCGLEEDGSKFVVTVVDGGLQVVSQSPGARPRKAVIKDASPASAEKLEALAHDAFGTMSGAVIFSYVRGKETLNLWARDPGFTVTFPTADKSTHKPGDVLGRVERKGGGKKKFAELVFQPRSLELRTSDPSVGAEYDNAGFGVQDDIVGVIDDFFKS